MVDDDREWHLPDGVSGNPNGKLTYTFSSNVTIGGFYVTNLAGEEGEGEVNGTNDFTIYVGEEIVVEDELPRDNGGDPKLNRFPLKENIRANTFSIVVKSIYGNHGGLRYFWFY